MPRGATIEKWRTLVNTRSILKTIFRGCHNRWISIKKFTKTASRLVGEAVSNIYYIIIRTETTVAGKPEKSSHSGQNHNRSPQPPPVLVDTARKQQCMPGWFTSSLSKQSLLNEPESAATECKRDPDDVDQIIQEFGSFDTHVSLVVVSWIGDNNYILG